MVFSDHRSSFESLGLQLHCSAHQLHAQRHPLDLTTLRGWRPVELPVSLLKSPPEILFPDFISGLDFNRGVLATQTQFKEVPMRRAPSTKLIHHRNNRVVQRLQNLAHPQFAIRGLIQTPGTQKSGIDRNQNLFNPQLPRQGTSVLRPRPAKCQQGMLPAVVSFAGRHLTQSFRHVLDGNSSQSLEQFLAIHLATDLLYQLLKSLLGRPTVQRQVDPFFVHQAEEKIDIGHRQRSATSITSRARIASRTFRSHF